MSELKLEKLSTLDDSVKVAIKDLMTSKSELYTQFGYANPRNEKFGAVGDGITDDTAAIKAAIATGCAVYLPAGKYKVTSMLTLAAGQVLRGDGRISSALVVGRDFDMTANGVITNGTSSSGAEIYDLGIEFYQPSVTSVSGLVQYPPAIYGVGLARGIIDRVRISGAMKGIDARGNSGGTYIGFVEIGSFDRAILIDGALDFFHGGHWHLWPFEFAGDTNLLNLYYTVDNGIYVNACDGLNIDSLSLYGAGLVITSSFGDSIPAVISKLQGDGNTSNVSIMGGTVNIGSFYHTGAESDVDGRMLLAGGTAKVNIGMLNYVGTSKLSSGLITTVGTAAVTINGGYVYHAQPAAIFAGAYESSVLSVNNVSFRVVASATQPVILSASTTSILKACNNTFSTPSTVGTAPIFYSADVAGNVCTGNSMGGNTIAAPSNGRLGHYAGNVGLGTAVSSGVIVGGFNTLKVSGTASSTGVIALPHNTSYTAITNVFLYRVGESGERVPITVASFDGNNINATVSSSYANVAVYAVITVAPNAVV